MRNKIFIFLALAGLIASCLWVYFDFGYEPIITGIGCLSTFLGLIWYESKKKKNTLKPVQKENSMNIKGDENISMQNIQNSKISINKPE